jgi:hypothetical protein
VPCHCLLLPDLDAQAVEEVFPVQWIEQSPGSFTYTYILHSIAQQSYYLAVDSAAIGQQAIVTTTAPPMLDLLNPSALHIAGQPLPSLQLNSSVIGTEFASLAASSTGWRISMTKPDNSSADLGLMADLEVWEGAVYKWYTSVHGSYVQQVSALQ